MSVYTECKRDILSHAKREHAHPGLCACVTFAAVAAVFAAYALAIWGRETVLLNKLFPTGTGPELLNVALTAALIAFTITYPFTCSGRLRAELIGVTQYRPSDSRAPLVLGRFVYHMLNALAALTPAVILSAYFFARTETAVAFPIAANALSRLYCFGLLYACAFTTATAATAHKHLQRATVWVFAALVLFTVNGIGANFFTGGLPFLPQALMLVICIGASLSFFLVATPRRNERLRKS